MTAFVRATVVLLCCAALGLGAQGGSTSEKELRDAVEKAKTLGDEGKGPEAAREYERALRLAKKNGAVTLKTAPYVSHLAAFYARQGRLDEAEPLLQRVLKIYDKKPDGNERSLTAALDNLAALYARQDRFDEAESLLRRTLKIRRDQHGKNHSEVAVSLHNLAWLYARQDQPAEAEPLFQQALKIREAKLRKDKLRKDHLDVAETLYQLARLYAKQGRYDEAEPLCKRALKIREDKLKATDPAVALALNELARVYHEQGRPAEAEPLYLRAVRIGDKGRAAGRPEPADPLDNLGRLYREDKRYAEAEPLIKRGLQIRETTLAEDHPQVVTSLNNLALLYDEQSLFAKAEPLYQQALRIQETRLGKDDPEVGKILHSLVLLYFRQGRYAEAEPLCRRALKIAVAAYGEEHPDATKARDSLGGLCTMQGRYAEAEPYYQQALKLREDTLGPDDPDVAVSLNNLAALYEWQARYKEAEPLLQRSLKIREKTPGEDQAEMANALNNLAWLYKQQRRFDDAEGLYKRSLKIREAKHGKNHPEVAAALNNLAALYGRQGRYKDAESLFRRALRIWEGKGKDKDHPDAAAALHNLALLCERQGRSKEAEALYRRALRIREARLNDNHPAVAATRNSLAELYAATGQWAKSAALFQKARRGLREHLRLNLAPLGPPQQLAYLARRIEPDYHAALTLASDRRRDRGMAELAAAWLLNGKGQTQEALAEPLALARAAARPGLKAVYEELLRVRGRAAFLTLESPPPGQEKSQREELGRLLRRERDLASQLARAGGRLAGPDWLQLADLRRALPADAVFVDFVRHGDYDFKRRTWRAARYRYLACVVPPAGQGAVEVIDLGPAAPIEKAAQAVRQALLDPRKTIGELGEPEAERLLKERLGRLADLVLKPLPPRLAKAAKWIIGPDAALWLVPFEALPLADGRYAVEGHSIRYVVSGRDLLVPDRAAPRTGPALVLADPDYDLKSDTEGSIHDGGPAATVNAGVGLATSEKLPPFARLPGTASEAAAVVPALERLTRRPPVLKTDKDAREQLVKTTRGPRVLLLSTHGYFLADQEAAVPELFADALQAALSKSGKPLENPWLRCGLALAGANRRGGAGADRAEDGILTGLEVVGCDLTGTELVVLSACETGLGQVNNGEGVAGLRQAFHLAGAKAVLASLWQIPDRPTAELMAAFFEELAQGKGGGPAEALRRAQLRQIERRRELDGVAHPFFWAAFTLTVVGGEAPPDARQADGEDAGDPKR